MEKADISKIKLTVSEFKEARKGFLTRRSIPFQKPRACDGLIFILDGSCRYTFNDNTKFEAKKFDVLYLAKNAIYEMDINCDRYEFFVLNFNFFSDVPKKSAVYPSGSPAYVCRLFSNLCFSRDTDTPQTFAQKMCWIYKIIEAITQNADRAYIKGQGRQKIELCADKIHLNFSDTNLSVAALASEAGYSEVYFRNLFVRRFGQTPSRYITKTRISHAIKLMELDGLTLGEIAEECGFSSLPYFNKVFKELIGETPASYRRSLAKRIDIT